MFFKLGEYTLATFLGVLVSFIVGHFLSKDRDRQTHKAIAFHEAAKEFRHSFDNILLNIEQGDHPVHELLRNFFLQHKVAIWHFKYYFTGKNRKRLEKTWNDYHDFYNEYYEEGSILAPFASTKTLCETQKLNELRGHIENLLKFTT
ncbi:MAG: hypothetical protein WC373_08885 [Smithella sp.]|jgi:hypothetical protein